MSINSVSGASAMAQLQRSPTTSAQSKNNTAQTTSAGSSPTPTSLGFDASAGIEVNLPNGLSVGIFSISPGANPFAQGAGTSAGSGGGVLSQMISSIEQMVAAFENSSVGTSSTASQGTATSGSSATGGSNSDSSINGIATNLPNGISIEVFESGQAGGTSDGSDGSSNQMMSAMEQLMAALDKYPAPGTSAGAAPSTASAGSVNAVA
jgi:hypothetical protein